MRLTSCLRVAVCLGGLACTDGAGSSLPPETWLQSDLAITGLEPPAGGFSRIVDLEVDRAGRLYLLDDGTFSISVFAPDGQFARRIGRRGRGPSEFLDPTGLMLDGDDHLYVYDPVQWRVSVFDSSGALAREFRISITSWGPQWDGGIDAEGWLLDRQLVVRSDTVREWRVRRLQLQTGETRWFPYPTCELAGATELHHEMGIAGVPFGAHRLTRIDPSGWVWCARSDRAVAYRVPFGGLSPIDSFVSTGEAAPVTAAQRAEALRSLQSQPIPPSVVKEAMALVQPNRPLVEGLATDADGRLWMQLRDARGSVFHVFTAAGHWVARLRVREMVALQSAFLIRDGRLYVTVLDDLDIPQVHRYPLPSLAQQ